MKMNKVNCFPVKFIIIALWFQLHIQTGIANWGLYTCILLLLLSEWYFTHTPEEVNESNFAGGTWSWWQRFDSSCLRYRITYQRARKSPLPSSPGFLWVHVWEQWINETSLSWRVAPFPMGDARRWWGHEEEGILITSLSKSVVVVTWPGSTSLSLSL